MAKYLEHPKYVPCPTCGTIVQVSKITIEVPAKGGQLSILNVPHYECTCGNLFIPQETESIIATQRQDKKLELHGNTKVEYEDLRRKGRKAIR